MKTAYITHPKYIQHTMPGHPEHAGRLRSVWKYCEALLENPGVIEMTPKPLSEDTILTAHTADHLDQLGQIEALSDSQLTLIDADTYMTPNSYTIARLAAGGVCMAVDAVMDMEVNNALAAVRPPGHHATSTTAMGFCLLNHVAIAARHAQDTHGIDRVLIVDFDVHHGNGTQDIFYDDDSVMFFSTHQSPLYPGSGMLEEIGTGDGEGQTINVPLRAGTGDAGIRAVYREILWPAARRFQPELILVSAGFDAHWQDPLAGLRFSLEGFGSLTEELTKMAAELCEGRIVFTMEGGYNLEAVGIGMSNVLRCLQGEISVPDPLGKPTENKEPDVSHLIQMIRDIHDLSGQ